MPPLRVSSSAGAVAVAFSPSSPLASSRPTSSRFLSSSPPPPPPLSLVRGLGVFFALFALFFPPLPNNFVLTDLLDFFAPEPELPGLSPPPAVPPPTPPLFSGVGVIRSSSALNVFFALRCMSCARSYIRSASRLRVWYMFASARLWKYGTAARTLELRAIPYKKGSPVS
eukprot:20427-Pelagococcus_subviridis.AAC.5